MAALLAGANVMACLVIALFFVRFWRQTEDRFFLFFAAAFAIKGAERALVAIIAELTESSPLFYMIPLVSYLLILVAILEKNRR